MTQDWWLNALWSVIPTLIIGALFGLILYAAMNADRKVREIRSEVEREFEATASAERADAVSEPVQPGAGTAARPGASAVPSSTSPSENERLSGDHA